MRILTLSCLLILSSTSHGSTAASSDLQTKTERADAQAERITDANQFLAEIDEALALAYNGEYGRLRRGSELRLETARERISDLLQGHDNASELPPDERIAIYNAQEVIHSILRNQDKSRMVCQRVVKTGSRLQTSECMTVAEREERARVARESTDKVQRNVCFPGEGSGC